MTNILIICRKEMKSYFVSPIAYALMAIYALISGWFSLIAIANFIEVSMQGGGPADLNGYVIAPVVSNAAVLSLFLIPMITMRLFAEEIAPAPLNFLSPRRSPTWKSSSANGWERWGCMAAF